MVDEDAWERGFAALLRFVHARGHASVPARAMAGGVAVGDWAEECRTEYWGGRLPADRANALEQLPGWSWDGGARRRWETRFAAVARFADENGHTAPEPRRIVNKLRIADWVAEQRRAHAEATLPRPLAARLEQLPGWTWHDDAWTRGVELAREYSRVHGGIDPSPAMVVEGFPLGRWVRRCRADEERGRLTAAQVAMLESLPAWTWSTRSTRWRRALAELRDYQLRHGDASPSQNTTANGFALGWWVHRRRRDYQAGRLSPDQIAEIESVPTWSWASPRAPGQHVGNRTGHTPDHRS